MRFRFRSPIPLAPLSLPFPSLFRPTLRYLSRLTGSDHELSSKSLVKPIDPSSFVNLVLLNSVSFNSAPLSSPLSREMVESLAVLLLNAEGDKVRLLSLNLALTLHLLISSLFLQFNTSFLSEGVKGGETAAELVYTLAKEKVVMDNNRDGETKLVVYLVS